MYTRLFDGRGKNYYFMDDMKENDDIRSEVFSFQHFQHGFIPVESIRLYDTAHTFRSFILSPHQHK